MWAPAAAWWLQRPLQMPDAVSAEAPLEVTIAPGTSARAVADTLVKAGVQTPSALLYAWFRLSGDSRKIKAGSYEFAPGTTPRTLLSKLVRGEQAVRNITILEGWNHRQVFELLRASPETVPAMVGRMYVGIDPRLFPAAERSVLAHLVDLENRGRVGVKDETWNLIA